MTVLVNLMLLVPVLFSVATLLLCLYWLLLHWPLSWLLLFPVAVRLGFHAEKPHTLALLHQVLGSDWR